MRLDALSTFTRSETMRIAVRGLQSDIASGEREISTGRRADYGLALGQGSAELTGARRSAEAVGRVIDTNAVVGLRLRVAQDSLAAIGDHMELLKSGLAVAPSPIAARDAIAASARQTLSAVESLGNAAAGGAYVFAGVATDTPPLARYEGSATQAAVHAAFESRFGFAIDDPAADGIGADAMRDFLQTAIEPLFLGPNWTAELSRASDQPLQARIGSGLAATVSVTANDPALRRVVMATAMVGEFFDSALGAPALEAVSRKVLEEAGAGLPELRSQVGLMQEQVGRSNAILVTAQSTLEARAASLEAVDPFEVANRLNGLLNQLEMSYALTARIRNLSILRFV